MNKLSQTFLDSCNEDNGFVMRGENMTRIETFVDAAFAFAITMLIISVDKIPTSAETLLDSARGIPAFIASGILIGQIWHWHSLFSRRFGLQDRRTIILSFCLVMLVLVFIYPIKLVFMGLFHWLSDGYLSIGVGQMNENDLSNIFTYFGLGFLVLSILYFLFYQNVLRMREALSLSNYEIYSCKTELFNYLIVAITALISIVIANSVNGIWITTSGFIYFSLSLSSPLLKRIRQKKAPSK